MSMEERVKQVEAFVAKIGLDWSQLGDKEKKRAKRAMSPDFSWSPSHGENDRKDTAVSFSEAFNDFLERLDLSTEGPTPEDSTPTKGPTPEDSMPKGPRLKKLLLDDPAHLFFDRETMDNYMVIRHQKSGICPLHSASLLQHYLHCKRAGNDATPDHKVLDISTYIRESLPEEDQRTYIEKGTTRFDSTGFFWQLTGTTLTLQSVDDRSDLASIHFKFQKYGEPMLIARCRKPQVLVSRSKLLAP